MKKVNGLLLSLLCISSISGLTSCTTAEDIVSEVKASLVFPNLTSGIKKGFDVYNEIDNVEISYESANPELLYFNEENTKCIVNVLDPGSSEKITSTSFNTFIALKVISSKLPIGVGIKYNVGFLSINDF